LTSWKAARTCVTPFRSATTKTGARAFTKLFPQVNKTDLRDAILRQLRTDLATQASAAQLARDEATNEESRARSKYDTHSQEAAYLAEGQARIAADIETSLEAYAGLPFPTFGPTDAIALGAVVELEAGSRRTWYVVGPRAGGLEIKLGDRELLVVTPQSPLGRELIGKRVGDVVVGPGRSGPQRIVAVE
jgi:transcription elongation GreA/GreB family factor